MRNMHSWKFFKQFAQKSISRSQDFLMPNWLLPYDYLSPCKVWGGVTINHFDHFQKILEAYVDWLWSISMNKQPKQPISGVFETFKLQLEKL
jgi:hypothetical protein